MLASINTQMKQIEKSIEDSYKTISKFNINLCDLENNFYEICAELIKKHNNCLYWFETENNIAAEELVNILELKRESLKQKLRVLPPKNSNLNSNVIYLGVRQGGKPRKRDGGTNISGRIYHHFGLYHVGSTQGLQLKYWANQQKTNLTLNILELKLENINHLYIIEKMFSIELRPLLGRH